MYICYNTSTCNRCNFKFIQIVSLTHNQDQVPVKEMDQSEGSPLTPLKIPQQR